MNCDGIIIGATIDCEAPLTPGVNQRLTLFNFDDIEDIIYSGTTITAIQLKAGTTAHAFEGVKQSLTPNYQLITGPNTVSYDHQVDFLVFDISQAQKDNLEAMAYNKICAVVENRNAPGNGNTFFEVYGIGVGMELISDLRVPGDLDTTAAFQISLKTSDNEGKEPKMPQTWLDTDYDTTLQAVDDLITTGGGGAPPTNEPEVDAIIARMPQPLEQGEIDALNVFAAALKARGEWDSLFNALPLCFVDDANKLTPLKANGNFTPSGVNMTYFRHTAVFNGTDAYIDLNWDMGVGFEANRPDKSDDLIHHGIYCRVNDSLLVNTQTPYGVLGQGNAANFGITIEIDRDTGGGPGSGARVLGYSFTQGSILLDNGVQADYALNNDTIMSLIRQGSTTESLFKGTTFIDSENDGQPTAWPIESPLIGARRRISGATIDNYFDGQLGFWFIMDGPHDRDAFLNDLRTLIDALYLV